MERMRLLVREEVIVVECQQNARSLSRPCGNFCIVFAAYPILECTIDAHLIAKVPDNKLRNIMIRAQPEASMSTYSLKPGKLGNARPRLLVRGFSALPASPRSSRELHLPNAKRSPSRAAFIRPEKYASICLTGMIAVDGSLLPRPRRAICQGSSLCVICSSV